MNIPLILKDFLIMSHSKNPKHELTSCSRKMPILYDEKQTKEVKQLLSDFIVREVKAVKPQSNFSGICTVTHTYSKVIK